MKVVMFRGRGFISWLIRFQTRGQWSHCGIVDDDGRLYEAWQGKGVRVRRGLEPGPGVAFYHVIIGLTNLQKDRIREYLRTQLGKGYDYIGTLRFITRRRNGDENKLFCSEYVFNALKAGGVLLFRETHGWEVSPQMVPRSLALERDRHAEGLPDDPDKTQWKEGKSKLNL